MTTGSSRLSLWLVDKTFFSFDKLRLCITLGLDTPLNSCLQNITHVTYKQPSLSQKQATSKHSKLSPSLQCADNSQFQNPI